MKCIKMIMAKIRCKLDNGEWKKHYCTNDCKTCGYKHK